MLKLKRKESINTIIVNNPKDTIIDSFVCTSYNCNYSKVVDDGDLSKLIKLIEIDGGIISECSQICPNCHCNSLQYNSNPL